jgi:hypothetical protein
MSVSVKVLAARLLKPKAVIRSAASKARGYDALEYSSIKVY